MGEIKIKSGNLYPILIGEDSWGDLNDATHNNNNGELVVSMMGTDNNSGVYSYSGSAIRTVHKDLSTYSWSVEIKADPPGRILLGFQGDGVKTLNITNEYQKFTFNNQSFTSDKVFVVYNRTGVANTVYLRNFMLNEGSTALPYQPYFLNRPAHQYVNGEWIDIPTHHFINNRWQGELTSQSPLKFRADGEMLDWRVEGKTSENLFDANSSSVDGYIDDNGNIAYAGYPIKTYDYINIIKDTNYTLVFNKSPYTSTIRIAWYDDGYNFIKRNSGNTGTFVIKSPSNASYCRLSIDVGLTNVQLLEGTYTTQTIPLYEPYGGVGDWDETAQKYRIPVTVNGVTTNLYTDHQLMDGDSIDYATDQTQIPIATGNNVLTVDTAVQPKSVFAKFEG